MEGPLDPYIAPGAMLIGDVRLAPDTGIYPGATLRAIEAPIEIGRQSNVQDNCVVEAFSGYPVRIGARVSVGHNARVYGATIDDAALIAIGATVMKGAHIGTHAIVAANATVPEGMDVPRGKLVIGQGRILRDVTEAEIARIERGAVEYARLRAEHRLGAPARSS